MNEKILVINPGSTSTKIAVYEGEQEVWKASVSHSLAELQKYPTVFDQSDMREKVVRDVLKEKGEDIGSFAAVVSRGGCLPPVHHGAYEVTPHMIEALRDRALDQHAANCGAGIAYHIACEAGVKAYIYDALTIDEMTDINKISGLKGIRRPARGHYLNTRAAALRYCAQHDLKYDQVDLIVVHLGGGITINLHAHGRIADLIIDEEGPFSPERAGGIPTYSIVRMCYSGQYTKEEMMKNLQRRGGMISYFQTADMREIEKRIDQGDKRAAMVYEAMGKQVAENIARLAASNKGKIDQIILTGGLAYSKRFVNIILDYGGWVGPYTVLPGEFEMEALAKGALRVLRGQEKADLFTD